MNLVNVEGVHLVGPVFHRPLFYRVGRDGDRRSAIHLIGHECYTGPPLGDVEVRLVLVAGAGILGKGDDAFMFGFARQKSREHVGRGGARWNLRLLSGVGRVGERCKDAEASLGDGRRPTCCPPANTWTIAST